MRNVTLAINGKTVRCPTGTSLLDVCTAQGIAIPTLCHHPQLRPFGACRLCIVEDGKTGRLFASCVTPAAQDMDIATHSERVVRHRRNIVRLMMAEHPESCLVCGKGNRCQLRQIAAALGVGQTGLYPMPNYKGMEQANPFIVRDLTKCILCGKCIRADHELVAAGAIDYNHRGFQSRPATLFERPLEQSECTFCGTCVSMCPTGALSMKNIRYVGSPERERQTVCGFCAVGCALSLGVSGGALVEAGPSPEPGTVNGATLCVRGHFAHDWLHSPDRLAAPLVRKDGQLVEVSWTEAIETACKGLLAAKKEHGPRTVGLLGSSKCTNEENYLFQKIARVALETNNIDNGGHLFGAPLAGLLDFRLGGRFRKKTLASLEKAQVLFVLGADPGQSAPVAGYHIKRAARSGVPLIVASPLPTDLDRFATLRLQVAPGRDLDMLDALAALLVEKRAYDSSFIAEHTQGFPLFRAGLGSLDVQRAAHVCGIRPEILDKAAGLLAGKKTAFVAGQGILQQPRAAEAVDALVNLALMTGSLGNGASGVMLLQRENNQAGAHDMGSAPDSLPGRSRLADDAVRKAWEHAWKVRLSPDRGLSMTQMIREAEKGNLKALYVMGENPARSLPNPEAVRKALENVDFLVVQDVLLTETARLAHVVLPGASFAEKQGSFTNMEGRIQSFGPALPLVGAARPDWEILAMIAKKLGMEPGCSELEDIRKEIARLAPLYGERYLEGPSAWVQDAQDPPGPMQFTTPVCSDVQPGPEGYAFTAIVGSMRLHLGAGTRTSLSSRIASFAPGAWIEMAPVDAAGMGIKEGDPVTVVSRSGRMEGYARLVDGQAGGLVRAPAGVCGNAAAALADLPSGPLYCGCKTFPVNVEKRDET